MEPLIPQVELEAMLRAHGVQGISIAVLTPTGAVGDSAVRVQTAGLADVASGTPMADSTFLEIASLSKPIAAAFAIDYLARADISLDAPVAPLLEAAGAPYRPKVAEGHPAEWADQLTLRQLMDHTGLGMHYVNGVPLDEPFPPVLDLISGTPGEPAPARSLPGVGNSGPTALAECGDAVQPSLRCTPLIGHPPHPQTSLPPTGTCLFRCSSSPAPPSATPVAASCCFSTCSSAERRSPSQTSWRPSCGGAARRSISASPLNISQRASTL